MEKRKCFFTIREVTFDRPTKIRYVTPPKNNNFLPAIEQKLSVLARILANRSGVRRVRRPQQKHTSRGCFPAPKHTDELD